MLFFLFIISDEKDHFKIEYIYNHFHDDMIRFAKYRLKKAGLPNYEMDAEDAVQNAFLKITKYIHAIDIDVNRNELKSYVLTIVSNETSNITADYTYFEDFDDHIEELRDDEFYEHMRINERYEEVVETIKKLDDKYSIILLYRYRNNMSVSQIAELMGLPDKTVYTRLERGKKLLLKLLGGMAE